MAAAKRGAVVACEQCGRKFKAGRRGRRFCSVSCGRTQHGHSKRSQCSPEYRAWVNMKNRCLNPNGQDWSWYGGRGISIDPVWRKSFESFYTHVGPRPSAKHSLDRINPNGDYEPGNVRWVLGKIQIRNRTITRTFTWRGCTRPLAEWAEETGLAYATLLSRHRMGWPEEEMFAPLSNRSEVVKRAWVTRRAASRKLPRKEVA